MGQIQVTVAEMEEKKNQVNQLISQILEEIEETSQIVNALNSEWEGDASEAFQQSYRTNSARLLAAVEALRKFVQVLDKIIETYIRTEAMNAKIAKQI